MGEIVNLRRARKSRARLEKLKSAEENRLRFGESAGSKAYREAEQALLDAPLEGASLPRDCTPAGEE